jgi:lipopolysaccharide kinase (Kdo/WaaP) family protein
MAAKTKIKLHMQEDKIDWLQKFGLVDFDTFMSGDIGELVERVHLREVRRICCAQGHVAYLKRRFGSSLRASLETYLSGTAAHSAPYNEFLHVQALQAKNLPVMQVIAAGESRRFGLPDQGFIVSLGVSGEPLNVYYNRAAEARDEKIQEQSLATYGEMLGQLHRHGFYSPLRMKDIFVPDENLGQATMIDRETRHPYPRKQKKWLADKALNTSFKRNARTSEYFGEEQVKAVLKAYSAEQF